ncbi:flavin reductase family protein [Lichenicoccus sp.]|uniref:flavin reductase family protein n=1 Tax=Lichenicoccus sp. TaxID=2781899 RepID=UPI003D09C5E9
MPIDLPASQAGDVLERAEETAHAFRLAMRRHAASVWIISRGCDDDANGMAITALTSFSMDPLSVLVCVNQAASMASALAEGTSFGLTLLGSRHEAMAVTFSRKPSGRPRFSDPAWRIEADGPPWLAGAPVNLVCTAERSMAFGSHKAIVGRVRSVRLGPDDASLVYRNGLYA